MSFGHSFQRGLVVLSLITGVAIAGCSSNSVPADSSNICSIFQEKDDWYAAAHKIHSQYGVPIHVAMAIMHQDTKFCDTAESQSDWFLLREQGRNVQEGGYTLVSEEIWEEYKAEEGSFFTSRENFKDSLGFIAWHMLKTQKEANIALSDAYQQYLSYHEGLDGYRQGTYRSKAWLIKAAQDVAVQAENYRKQLLHCQIY